MLRVPAAMRPLGTTLAHTVSVNPIALTATDPRPIATPVALPDPMMERAPLRLWYW